MSSLNIKNVLLVVLNLHHNLVNDSCANESMRLVNGTTMFDGIVEVCLNGVWGNIISYGWNTPDAEVVCRQLGLSWRCESYLLSIKNNMYVY